MLELLASKGVGSLAAGLGNALGGALGGGGPFVGGSAQSGAYGTTLTKAGAVYNFGSGTTTDTTSSTSTATTPAAPLTAGMYDQQAAQAGLSPWMMVALALFAYGIYRRA